MAADGQEHTGETEVDPRMQIQDIIEFLNCEFCFMFPVIF